MVQNDVLDKARDEGRAEGRAEGVANVAKKMIASGMGNAEIVDLTGLSTLDIESLRNS